MSRRFKIRSSSDHWGGFYLIARNTAEPSLLHREKKPKEGTGGFSRRCSKLINSCEYLEAGVQAEEAVVPKMDRAYGYQQEGSKDPKREDWQRSAAAGSFCLWTSTHLSYSRTLSLSLSLSLPHVITFAAQLLYQEYSDVFLNKEIQSQQRLDSLSETSGLASPRQPRKGLVSSESYLQRLSMASSGSLWQEIPVVRNSTVLLSMTHEDQKLQEVTCREGWGLGKGQRKDCRVVFDSLFISSPPPPPPLWAAGPHTPLHLIYIYTP
jgi:hypothetical protein